MEIVRVARGSSPSKVAGAIAGIIREGKQVRVRAIGAGAANQAIKAVIVARRYLAEDGVDLICIPGLTSVSFDRQKRLVITLTVEPR